VPSAADADPTTLRRTALHRLHEELGGRMVPFAGYEMPVQYPAGAVAEHRHCRAAAALFDVGHMGVVHLAGYGADAALEGLVPSSIVALPEGRQRYTVLTNERGGIVDDLMVARLADRLSLVVNAARTDTDLAHLRAGLPDHISVEHRTDLSLIALQGPAAVGVLGRLAPDVGGMVFMDVARTEVAGVECTVSRSGYTGEDGFELAVPAAEVEGLARRLLAEPEVEPAGLGARDSLRLEAGLCLYGSDLDESTTPVEADLGWIIQRRRREEGGFAGDEVVLAQLRDGVTRLRVGLTVADRRPVRSGAQLRAVDGGGGDAGVVTSGGFAPTLGHPVAMGYVAPALSSPGTELIADVRGHQVGCRVAPLPFIEPRYVR
jgi:aminomethyltransferase